MPTPTSYTTTAKALHWLMAALIIALWCVGLVMEELPKGDLRGTVFGLHKAFGVIVLVLVVIRLAWRATHPAPELPANMPPLERWAAKLGHVALYLLMIALPVDGILMSQSGGRPVDVFGLVLPTLVGKSEPLHDVLGEGHEILAWVLAVLVVGHVAAAIRHHLILKDDVLTRMLARRT